MAATSSPKSSRALDAGSSSSSVPVFFVGSSRSSSADSTDGSMQGRKVVKLPQDEIVKFFSQEPKQPFTPKESLKKVFCHLGYQIISVLGEGSYATVYKVQNAAGKVFAAKVFKPNISPDEFTHEQETLKQVHKLCPNSTPEVINAFQFNYEEFETSPSKNKPKNIGTCIVLSYSSRSLAELTQAMQNNKTFLPLEHVHHILFQLLQAMRSLETTYEHLDLKLENLLVDWDGKQLHLKVSDFGQTHSRGEKLSTPFLQTLFVRSPYALILKAQHSDIFSVGCILYKLLTNEILFKITLTKKEYVNDMLEDYPFCTMSLEALQPYEYLNYLDSLNYFEKVFNVLEHPTQEFIEQTDPEFRSLYFKEKPDGTYEFLNPTRHTPNYIFNKLQAKRPDLTQDDARLYANLIMSMLNYENPPSAEDMLRGSFFKTMLDQDTLEQVS